MQSFKVDSTGYRTCNLCEAFDDIESSAPYKLTMWLQKNDMSNFEKMSDIPRWWAPSWNPRYPSFNAYIRSGDRVMRKVDDE